MYDGNVRARELRLDAARSAAMVSRLGDRTKCKAVRDCLLLAVHQYTYHVRDEEKGGHDRTPAYRDKAVTSQNTVS